MQRPARRLTLFLLACLAAAPASAADGSKQHRVVFQVDTADTATMSLTLNNATNVVDYYRDKNEEVEIDIVAFGPGLAMYRADKSTVADRIAHFADYGFPSKVQFSACNNTKTAMEKAEGHPIELLPQATIVPSGVVQIMERQEQGWSYVRP
ncbi:hypothetical protein HCU64_22275 [Methylobacterium sp. C25]|uniref:DsrE family protein n=1 Tax=Methylobacterium sp. C25 TaxID=2721622 RepID=UPI001F42DF9A|nr:hypothetical protein [Methylobacterium sp. C25]MCE4226478.1 hypothetical protein [Methylobacterium sp. C25]